MFHLNRFSKNFELELFPNKPLVRGWMGGGFNASLPLLLAGGVKVETEEFDPKTFVFKISIDFCLLLCGKNKNEWRIFK